jgi:hypothetical protein
MYTYEQGFGYDLLGLQDWNDGVWGSLLELLNV